jgi:hypothetical protein
MNDVNVKYGVDSINKAIKKLKDKNFIILVTRGYYQVNPKYFMKNNDNKREELIKINLEFNKNKDYTDIEIEE